LEIYSLVNLVRLESKGSDLMRGTEWRRMCSPGILEEKLVAGKVSE
jgi:hypothetical protein